MCAGRNCEVRQIRERRKQKKKVNQRKSRMYTVWGEGCKSPDSAGKGLAVKVSNWEQARPGNFGGKKKKEWGKKKKISWKG